MDDFVFDELNYLLRIHVQHGNNGELRFFNMFEPVDLQNEQGGGDMTAHNRIFPRRNVHQNAWKKFKIILNITTVAVLSVIILRYISLFFFFFNHDAAKSSVMSDVDDIGMIKYHLQGCLGTSYIFASHLRLLNNVLKDSNLRNDTDLKTVQILEQVKDFYQKLVWEVAELKLVITKINSETSLNI